MTLTCAEQASLGLFCLLFWDQSLSSRPCFCIQSFPSVTRGAYAEQGHLPSAAWQAAGEGDLFRASSVPPRPGVTQHEGSGWSLALPTGAVELQVAG